MDLVRLPLIDFKTCFTNRRFCISLLGSFLLLSVSLVVNFYAGNYATESASSSVTDLILDHLPIYEVDEIFIYGAMLMWIFLTLALLFKPYRAPFTLYCVSLFVLIRAAFISLTHLGPPSNHIVLTQISWFDKLSFGGDLFFSGHTGLPFLLALIFWDQKIFRYIFLSASVIFACVVLMGHLHYSIDVFAAYFITYSIFHIGQVFFKKHQRMFVHGVEEIEKVI